MSSGGMSDPSPLDDTYARDVVARARDELATGDDKEAARLLTDVAYHARDPEIERQVRELAAQGLDRSGRFGRGRWKEIIRIVDSLQAFSARGRPRLPTA